MPASPLPETALVFCVFLTLLVPLAAAGLALINAGLGRSRSAAHSIMAALCVIAVAAIVYFICGFAWQGFIGRSAHIMMVGGKPWNWIAAEPFFFRGLQLDGSAASLAAWLQMLRLCGRGRLKFHPGARWPYRSYHCLDPGSTSRQVLAGRNANRHPRT